MPNLDMEEWWKYGNIKVKQSHFFTEYANTAQFS